MEIKTSQRFESHLIENREVRIFLSSTFSDMDAERSALVKLFSKLKLEANQRNVALTLLDLRWGVTDEESRTGKVLSVCLNEIENSHPFFIGLLGSRYGYAPKALELEKNPDLKERYPWIKEDISNGMSITEIEMQYGVLRNQENVDAAFFIKDTPGMLPDDDEKLTALKSKIRGQKRFPVGNYKSTDYLCEQVEKMVMDLLNKYFNDADNSRLGRERTIQQAYINSRHRFYLPRQKDFDRLNQFLIGDECHLVVTGKSGMGKSALIANWLKDIESNDAITYNIIYHFVGNSFGGNSYYDVLQHISDELFDLYDGLELRMGNEESIEEKAQHYMTEAVQKGDKPMLIVIDGINQIDNQNQAKLLNWLPQSTHKVKYLFSTLEDDETMQTFLRREYLVYTVTPLDERNKFIIDYLSLVGKKLDGNQIRRILKNKITENTLVLKTLLDELICFGSYEHLNERIDFYLAATSIPGFFDRMLQRLEQDYMDVQRLLSLIAVSEHGLSEDELLGITDMRQMDFHLFYCAISAHLVNRGGLLVFAHQYITNAIVSRYHLEEVDSSKPYREEIISYFSKEEIIDRNRQISELAYQYYSVDDCENLYKIILSFEAFEYFDSTTMREALLALYWRKLLKSNPEKYQLHDYLDLPHEGIPVNELPYLELGAFSVNYLAKYDVSTRIFEEFLSLLQTCGEKDSQILAMVLIITGSVYNKLSKYELARDYYQRALEIVKNSRKADCLEAATIYNNLGIVNYNLCDYAQALNLIKKALNICERKCGSEHLVTSALYNSLGAVYKDYGKYSLALDNHKKALYIYEKLLGFENPYTAKTYDYLGLVYLHLDNNEQALTSFKEALRINEKILGSDHPDTATSYNNLGLVYCRYIGDYVQALFFYQKALNIWEKLWGVDQADTASCYNNIGLAYHSLNDYTHALEFFQKALNARSKILPLDHPDIAESLNGIGLVYQELNEYEYALEYYQKALSIYKKKKDIDQIKTAQIYDIIGSVYLQLDKKDKAIVFLKKALNVRKKMLGVDHPDSVSSYNIIGDVYKEQGDYKHALTCYRKVLNIQRKVFGLDHSETVSSYNIIGEVYRELGDYRRALGCFKKVLNIRKKVYGLDHPDTATSYNKIGFLFYNLGDNIEALKYSEKALRIREKVLGLEHFDTAQSYYNIGVVYYRLGKKEQALYYFEKELLYYEKKLGCDHLDTAKQYNLLGKTHKSIGNITQALNYYQKALKIYQHKVGAEHPDTAATLNNIGLAYLSNGDKDQALLYLKKALNIRERLLGTEHPDIAESSKWIGAIYYNLGSKKLALEYGEKALKILEKLYGEDYPDTQVVKELIRLTLSL